MKIKSIAGCCQIIREDGLVFVVVWHNLYIQETWTDEELKEHALSEILYTFPMERGFFEHKITSVVEMTKDGYDIILKNLLRLN